MRDSISRLTTAPHSPWLLPIFSTEVRHGQTKRLPTMHELRRTDFRCDQEMPTLFCEAERGAQKKGNVRWRLANSDKVLGYYESRTEVSPSPASSRCENGSCIDCGGAALSLRCEAGKIPAPRRDANGTRPQTEKSGFNAGKHGAKEIRNGPRQHEAMVRVTKGGMYRARRRGLIVSANTGPPVSYPFILAPRPAAAGQFARAAGMPSRKMLCKRSCSRFSRGERQSGN